MKVQPFDPAIDYTNIVTHDTLCNGLCSNNFEQAAQGLSWCLRRALLPGDFDLLEDTLEAFKTFPGSSPGASTISKLLLGTHSIGKNTAIYGKYAATKIKAATLNRIGDEVYSALCRSNAYDYGTAHGPDNAFVQHAKKLSVFKQMQINISKMSNHPTLTAAATKNPISTLTEAAIIALLKSKTITLPPAEDNYKRLVPARHRSTNTAPVLAFPIKAQKLSATKTGMLKRVDLALNAEGFVDPNTVFSFDSTKIPENAWRYYPIVRLQLDANGALVQMDAGWRHTLGGKLSPQFYPDTVLKDAVSKTFPEISSIPEIS